MRKALLISILIIFCFSLGDAQNIGSRTEIYSIEEGLSQSSINHLLLDSKGFLWLATKDGLNRFDGKYFTVFKHIPSDTNSLSDNYIRHLCEDRNGNIWAATNNGLSCYNPSNGNFINYYNETNNSNSISSNTLYFVFEDRNGTIWVKTLETIEKLDLTRSKFAHYSHYNNVFNYISGDFLFDIFEDSKGKLWIGTKDGLNCFDRNLELFERFEYNPNNKFSISDNRVKIISEDKNGNIWIGTENGLNKFDIFSKKFTRYYNSATNSNSLISNSVNDIFIDKENKLWIATMAGFCTYETQKNNFTQYKYIYYKNSKLALTGISSITIDKASNLWLGSYEGLTKIDLKPFKIGLYRSSGETYSFNVSSIFSSDARNVWIGTWGNGLIKRNLNNNQTDYYNTSTLNGIFTDNNIYALFSDNKSNIWIGTGNGIVIFDKNTNKFKNFKSVAKECTFLDNNRVYAFHQDKVGRMWIGSEYGLHQYNPKTNSVQNYVQIPDSQGIAIHTALCFTDDSIGNLWIGTNDGLVRYNIENKEYKKYLSNPKLNINSICSNTIYSLLCSSKGIVWVGTNAGLCRYNDKNDDFSIYTENEGLPNNTIYAMLEDGSKNIWLSTNNGIICFDPNLETFTTFDLADGLQGYEFNLGAASKTSHGELFFGGINGLNFFHPDSLTPNNNKPNIQVTSIEMIGRGIKKVLALCPGKTIHVPSYVKLFTISFAALDFTYPANNQYMYKISSSTEEGLWISLGNKSYVQFSNLTQGKYHFKVKGSNSDKVWSSNEYDLYLIIESPIWKTKIAIIIYIILLITIGYATVQIRTRKLVRTNRELTDKEHAAKKIAQQKEELTLKNKNITDSINYAKRIQVAVMPSERTFKRLLPDSFVFHKPKDIVSGDFYWIYEKQDKVFVAAVDCTGHGVPGAFMSILGIELFRKITMTDIDDPGKILARLNEEFSRIFSDVEDISLRDGMDIAFCVIDKKNNLLYFAGAVNPMYLVRDNKIIEIKGNRYSVSIEKKQEALIFETHKILLENEDMFYIFSDGYADQFGGYEGKKFKYRRFRHLLLNIHKLPLEDQKKYLDESMDTWKGALEQVDDLLVIGIKVNF
jgi:ligand-binding sensor domain-containing protein/serine phosphatase RsbU (regulator of sigma subunit)